LIQGAEAFLQRELLNDDWMDGLLADWERIPLRTARPEPADGPDRGDPRPVAILTSNPSLGQSFADSLRRRFGIPVVFLERGVELAGQVIAHLPQLVVLDADAAVPPATPEAWAHVLRLQPELAGTPLALICARKDQVDSWQRAGYEAVLVQPFRWGELERLLLG
jgi:hypothetical protein